MQVYWKVNIEGTTIFDTRLEFFLPLYTILDFC